MSNKISLEKDDFDLQYEPSDSEDDYSEEEKQLLKEVRKGNRKKINNKEEILPFNDSSDEENDEDAIAASDIEGAADGDLDIPDSMAWGKQRRTYYNTDFIDPDYNTYDRRQEEEAQQEEEEAKAIQSRLAKQLDEADFFLDIQETAQIEETLETDLVERNLSDLSKKEKLKLFHKDSPEFAGLVTDFQSYLNESKEMLCPILELSRSQNVTSSFIDFLEVRNNIILSYCTNIAFYIYLKTRKISIRNHPITKRLAQSRKLLLQLQQRYENIIKPQLEKLLERIKSGEEVKLEMEKEKQTKTKHTLNILNSFRDGEESEKEEILSYDKQENVGDEGSEEEESMEDDEMLEETGNDERRAITYQISKNKGLTPYRKKENRNPRVKHRSKFRKALIRRKGAVRTIRKETKRYGGEISGIKSTVIKAIKFKT